MQRKTHASNHEGSNLGTKKGKIILVFDRVDHTLLMHITTQTENNHKKLGGGGVEVCNDIISDVL